MVLFIFSANPSAIRAASEPDPALISLRTETGSSDRSDDPSKPGGRYRIFGGLYGRMNAKGVALIGGANYRNVYDYDRKHDTASAYWQTGIDCALSPAHGQIGPYVEWQPWIMTIFRLQYDYSRFFGAYGGIFSFSTGQDNFGDNILNNRDDEEKANGHRFLFQPTLQGKMGKVYLRNQSEIAYYLYSGNGPYFRDVVYNTLLQNHDYLFVNRTHVMYEVRKFSDKSMFLMGPFYEVVRADSAQITQQRTGAQLYLVPGKDPSVKWKPKAALQIGYHLEDPSRQGQLFMTFGLVFELDL